MKKLHNVTNKNLIIYNKMFISEIIESAQLA